MLGNFSFGDYFKREAIRWAWEFCVDSKWLGLPAEKLSVSIYEDDEEAFEVWDGEIKVPKEKIFRFDAHDNFWPADAPSEAPAGQLCGPCSEIFYDTGPNECARSDCSPACDCRRHVEIWNLVFQQFEKGDAPGELAPLSFKNIDTGAGLERVAAVLQGAETNFGIDIFRPLVEEAARLTGAGPGREPETVRRLRRIADHARAVTFCLADGVLPSNEGRGYVVRRLLRRAVLDGRALGLDEALLYALVAPVARVMRRAYPELEARRENLARLVKAEEENFRATLERGMNILRERMEKARSRADRTLDGRDAFELYDTYGFPVEITEEILAEAGLSLDREGFEKAMAAQRARARATSAMTKDVFGGVLGRVKRDNPPTEFVRDWKEGDTAKVLAIVADGALVSEAHLNEQVQLVLDRTPFYGEAGGQVGDAGELHYAGGRGIFAVLNTTRAEEVFLHSGTGSGTLRVGDEVRPTINEDRRARIEANHTATHLVHHYLREVLGSHVEQSGSLVDDERLRLDFTHFEAVKPDEIARVERLVNEAIDANLPTETKPDMTVDEARARGAMALFGEKYGERVRMVETELPGGAPSRELCGGTHLARTGEAELFLIESEGAVGAGLRRIEARTGEGARSLAKETCGAASDALAKLGLPERFDPSADSAAKIAKVVAKARTLLADLAAALKTPVRAVPARVEELVARAGASAEDLAKLPADALDRVAALTKMARERSRAAEAGRAKGLSARVAELAEAASEVAGAKVVAARFDDADAGALRRAVDELRAKLGSVAALLASTAGGKVLLVCAVTPDLVKRGLAAGALVKACAKHVGGGGGGKPELAQAGGKNPEKLEEALAAFEREVAGALGN